MLHKLKIEVHAATFSKDPNSSELGKSIIKHSVDILARTGLENFTFKKLAAEIGTSEASIYRYFENKHKLLIYLVGWYWSWIEYQILFNTNNIPSAEEKLQIAIQIITSPVPDTAEGFHFSVKNLHRIVMTESPKTYLNASVDEENRHGYFKDYKNVVARISDFIHEINPDYKFPHSLISTVVEGAHHQQFFAAHLPSLTDCDTTPASVQEFFVDLVKKAIQS